ncbi:uncharacterized protein LOC107418510 isoform X2 [Ziziphus jujuba]|uniref:Uncharacterized protein LOC107418510 isoform X2 n=1 Tax=Ziziphus jujuba TaxID=326968 RepID=A0ABM3IK95_ZIZJJ|nr:uncharacterized protein LOC107418510 isoform X2 [Ziziphus jujuba]
MSKFHYGMAIVTPGNITNAGILCEKGVTSSVGILALPHLRARARAFDGLVRGNAVCQSFYMKTAFPFQPRGSEGITSKRVIYTIPRSSNSSNSSDSKDDSSDQAKTPFGYSRKDVLLIGVGVTVIGIGLKSGLEFAGVDPLQAGNVVQLVLVLGLTIGWISTYIFRVSNKEMTYAQQLRDYENKVMEKRLEGLSEAELEALLEQVEEEKRRLTSGEQVN